LSRVFLPASDDPIASVIMLCRGNYPRLESCLASLSRNVGADVRYEVILLLNDAEPDVIEGLQRPESTPGTDTFVFTPEADTYVDSSQPTTSYGTSTSLRVDASPASQSFLRFKPSQLEGRKVLGARLRMYQRDASPLGGRVFSMSSNSWSQSATWATKPAIDGRQLASFGSVQFGQWYEADVGAEAVQGDEAVSLAIDSTSSDGSLWGSREFDRQPQLVVEVEREPGSVADGLSQVAGPTFASSNPTTYAGNRRLATTEGGRQIAVHGRQRPSLHVGTGWLRHPQPPRRPG